MASVTRISAPFLPISYLCAIVSHLVTDSFDLGCFIVMYTAQWKLMTFNNGKPNSIHQSFARQTF